MHRLTGYTYETLNTTTNLLTGNPATSSWSLDSEGNRYSGSGPYATTYNVVGKAGNTGYAPGGDTTQITFDNSRSATVVYDAWGRVVATAPGAGGVVVSGGIDTLPAQATTTYQYDPLGRQIITNSGSGAGTQTYYDGNNPIEVRELNNSTPLMTYVWSPADGRLILRDAVASQLSSDTGLSGIVADTTGGVIQRLYPLTDALGSIVALAAPTGVVLERYVYTVDGTPQAINANRTVRTIGFSGSGGTMMTASTLGWNWLYRGEEWVMTHPQSTYSQGIVTWDGLYMSPAGQQWYDSFHARNLQPNLAAYADPNGGGGYTAWETFGATVAPVAAGVGVAIVGAIATPWVLGAVGWGIAGGGLTAGGAFVASIIAGAGGTAAMTGSSSFVAGGSASQVATAAAIGGVAGALGGAAGNLAGLGARAGLFAASLTCETGYGVAAGFAVGAAEGGVFGATQGFVQTGLMTGNLVDAVMAGWNGGLMGIAIGGTLRKPKGISPIVSRA